MGIMDNIKKSQEEAKQISADAEKKKNEMAGVSSETNEASNEQGKHIAKQNKDNYYNNIAYIAEVMVYVKFVAIVTIIMWALSAIGIFIVFAQ